ncbi:MAG: hypothetical protein ACIAXF_11435 [Phycisphaerales bacterium JB063]
MNFSTALPSALVIDTPDAFGGEYKADAELSRLTLLSASSSAADIGSSPEAVTAATAASTPRAPR